MRLAYLPGIKTGLAWGPRERYKKAQWQKLEILTDLSYAACFGFLHTRMPTPGRFLNPKAAEKRAKSVEKAWQFEAQAQGRGKVMKGLPVSEFPLETKLYLSERIGKTPPRHLDRGRVVELIDARMQLIERSGIQIRLLRDENQN